MCKHAWEAEVVGYQRLIQECRSNGLDPKQIAKSRTSLSHSISGTQHLKKQAFLPTGLALGCPMGDMDFTRRLTELSTRAGSYLSEVSMFTGPTLAVVPPESYHITVLNRTYFESSAEVFPLTEKELQSAEETIQNLKIKTVIVDVNGLLLTSSGKILVPGYPSSGDLDKLRREIGKCVNTLNGNVPKGATIKVGHVLVPLAKRETTLFLDWLEEVGKDIASRLVFRDLYTQVRRVRL